MRTLVDLPDHQLVALTRLATERGISRAALLREAVGDYLAREVPSRRDAAFGLWRTGEDGLAYQERMRAEW